MKKFEVIEHGIHLKAVAEQIKNTVWVHISGKNMAFEMDSGRVSKRKSKHSHVNPHLILAPMPGKVTKVFIDPGHVVKEGDPLIVMEAMKMEYTLKSSLSGKVKKIHCKVGDQVVLAFLLAELE